MGDKSKIPPPVPIRWSRAELARIDRAAARAGLTRSALVRAAVDMLIDPGREPQFSEPQIRGGK